MRISHFCIKLMFNIHSISTQIPSNSNGFNVLHENISFNLNPSDIVLLVGANGIGKSVFLKTLLKIQPTSNLDYAYNQTSLNNLKETDLASFMSLMLASPPNIELLSALEVILTGRQRFFSIFSRDNLKNNSMVFEIAKDLDIEHLLQRSFSNLSDGEKQKVMLARALAQDTPILLLDEPLAFLDYPSRIQFLTLLKKIAIEKSKIIILSSHDIDISIPFVTRILALSKNQHTHYLNPAEFSASDFFSKS